MTPEVPVGQVLGGTYRLERLLGEGGMGAVYEASHARVPRRFAVKLLHPGVIGNKDIFERFQREAQIVSALGHINIVSVFDFNYTDAGLPYMVLELLKGCDLADRIKSCGRLSLAETATIAEQVASALEAAHAQGIVHRDLKPQNVFLHQSASRELVKVLDFGISKILHSSSVATQTGSIMGTPHYMSPEQADGRQGEIDARTDVFAFAVLLFECLSGRPAFDGETIMSTLYKVCHEEPASLHEHAPDVPAAVEEALVRGLAKRREDRTPSVGALCNELFAAAGLTSQHVAATPTVTPSIVLGTGKAPVTGVGATVDAASMSSLSEFQGHSRKRRVGLIAAVVGGAGILAGAAAVLLGGGSGDKATSEEPAIIHTTAPETEPKAKRVETAVKVPQFSIELDIEPPHATVELDGLVTSERELTLPKSDAKYRLRVTASGYIPSEHEFRVAGNGEVKIHLQKKRLRKRGRRGSTDRRIKGPIETDLE